jgi:hypothetical protein
MAVKDKKQSLIALELEGFERKIIQFQDYLEGFPISKITDQKERHAEITAQIGIMGALPKWLAELKTLREVQEKKKQEVRGGYNISGLAAAKLEE